MKVIIKRRRSALNANLLFLFAWSVLITYNLFIESSEIGIMISTRVIKIAIYGFTELLLLLKLTLVDRYDSKRLALFFAVGVVALIVARESTVSSLLLYLSFLLAGKNVDIETFVKNDMILRLTVFIALFVLSVTGIIPNYIGVINGAVKIAFGWIHPNTAGNALSIIALEWMYLHWGRMTWRRWAVIVAEIVFMNVFISARGYLYAFLLICVWYIVVQKRNRLPRLFHRAAGILYGLAYPGCMALSFLLVYIYRSGSALGVRLNALFTTRLSWSSRFLNEYGLSLFGQSIETVSTRQAIKYGISVRILDMSYIRIGIEQGIVFMVLFLVSYIYLSWNLYKNNCYRELMIALYFAVVGITSTATINFLTNYTLIFLWLIYKEHHSENRHEIN